MNIPAREINQEVAFTLDPITKVNRDAIQRIKAKASENRRKTARLCTHLSVDDKVHEMLIVHSKGSYVRPHKHPGKATSYHIIEGELDLVVFSDDGGVFEVISMGEYPSGLVFFWRLSDSRFYTLVAKTNTVVIHETAEGPFDRATSTIFADWAPEECDLGSVQEYTKHLGRLIEHEKERHKAKGSRDQG